VAPDPLDFSAPAQARAELLGLEFLADFFGHAAQRKPLDLDSLSELAQILTMLGRHPEALRRDRELVRQLPDDPTAHYNLACSLALVGHGSEALDALERAVELGYEDGAHLAEDEDLATLRHEPRFTELLARLEAP